MSVETPRLLIEYGQSQSDTQEKRTALSPQDKLSCIVSVIQQAPSEAHFQGWRSHSVIEDYSGDPSACGPFFNQFQGRDDPSYFFAARLKAYIEQLEREVHSSKRENERLLHSEQALKKLVERSLNEVVAKLNERLLSFITSSSPRVAEVLRKAKKEEGVDLELLLKELRLLESEALINNWILIEQPANAEDLTLSAYEKQEFGYQLISLEVPQTELSSLIEDITAIKGFLSKEGDPEITLPPPAPGNMEIILRGLLKALRFVGEASFYGLTSLFSVYREVIRAATFFGVATVVLQSPWTPVTQAVGGLLIGIARNALHV
ncbi:hypothetical protein [Estrella lausannensis]|uniref:Uncharacterized protein n=1 Tax=Estrella lausannensis TaxID=483423 RepID=A0A0H5DPH6_9BACT|nr:hypothetical protein [Estrella lausannensis]CRX38347.1 hypothetical protein ELAC_1002 [Estrella lausannensis]